MYKFSAFLWTTLILGSPAYALNLALGLTPPNQQNTVFNYTSLLYNQSSFPQGTASTSFQEMEFSTPVFKNDSKAFTLDLNANQLAVNPPQGTYSTFSALELNLGYTRALDTTRLWALSARYGSASDKIFADSTVSTAGATGYYSFADNKFSRWLLLIDYANDRPILNNLPLPGIAYFYVPSRTFRTVLGAPFASLNWNFSQDLFLDFYTIVPWIIKGSVNYKLDDLRTVHLGFDFSQLTYFLQGRQNNKERLFYDEKKVFLGTKLPLTKNTTATFEVGHTFDRTLFVAEEYQIDPHNSVGISNSFYAKVSMLCLL